MKEEVIHAASIKKVREIFNLADVVKRVRMHFSKANENHDQGFPEVHIKIDDVVKQVANDLFELKIGEVSSGDYS